jgi:hypothetical protein
MRTGQSEVLLTGYAPVLLRNDVLDMKSEHAAPLRELAILTPAVRAFTSEAAKGSRH